MNNLRYRKVKKLAKGYKSSEWKSNEALKLTNPVALKPVFYHSKGLLKHKMLSSTSRGSDSFDLGCNLRMCISNKFPGDVDAC